MQYQSSTVNAEVDFDLLDDAGCTSPVQAELRYDAADPFAICGDFCLDGHVVRWVFARALLRTGLYEPTGAGDVRVRPSLDHAGRAVVLIELSSPDGSAAMRAPANEVAWFLRRTEGVVPNGCESAHVDLDGALDRLLGDHTP